MTRLLPALLLTIATPVHASGGLDLDRYAALLERHTRAVADTAGTRVDYAGLRSSSEWPALVAGLDAEQPDGLPSRAARLAFWINAYNILAIDLVVQGRPETSIRDLGSFLRPVWKRTAGRVGGRKLTLDEIEHQILRPMGEPRIHVAIVCASTSCPSLRREPFRAERLEAQLDEQARAFVANPEKGMRIDRNHEDLRVSRIFDWFREDFGDANGLVAWLVAHAPEKDRAWLAEHADEMDIVYLDYDWRLNGLPAS